MRLDNPDTGGSGSGRDLPLVVLTVATLSALLATALSLWTVTLQLKNYRKIGLQRFTVRILVMVPIYSISSVISLYSLDAAFFLDLVRDCYESFVIYCFFTLLVEYLGGERSLIILLHGRPPIPHPWPISVLYPPLDCSDPFTFLGIKRGILQYVQIKPLLALLTALLKATGTYKDGSFEAGAGYAYIATAQNLSVTLSLYCLVCFWKATHNDLKPFRPMPKFLCVKGILFFTFWQGFAVSILVALGIVKSDRFPTEMLSIAIQDTAISLEMPLFAFLHMYAFSYTDYIDRNHVFSGRLPFFYALRDAFGFRDVVSDSLTTVKGTGFSYRTFEPAEGTLHVGLGRERRVKAGLRYADGGKVKYWLPMPGEETEAYGRKGKSGLLTRPIHAAKQFLDSRVQAAEGYAPIGADDAKEVVHRDDGQPELEGEEYAEEWRRWKAGEGRDPEDDEESEVESLGFEGSDEGVEELYKDSRRLEFGDFNYPIVDASREDARRKMRDEEDELIYSKRSKKGKQVDRSPPSGQHSYGRLAEGSPAPRSLQSAPAISSDHPEPEGSHLLQGLKLAVTHTLGVASDDEEEEELNEERIAEREQEEKDKDPTEIVDLVVADYAAEEEEMLRDRRKGEPVAGNKRVFRQLDIPFSSSSPSSPALSATSPLPPSPSTGLEQNGLVLEHKDTVLVKEEEGEEEREVRRLRVVEAELVSSRVDTPEVLVENNHSHDSSNPWS